MYIKAYRYFTAKQNYVCIYIIIIIWIGFDSNFYS